MRRLCRLHRKLQTARPVRKPRQLGLDRSPRRRSVTPPTATSLSLGWLSPELPAHPWRQPDAVCAKSSSESVIARPTASSMATALHKFLGADVSATPAGRRWRLPRQPCIGFLGTAMSAVMRASPCRCRRSPALVDAASPAAIGRQSCSSERLARRRQRPACGADGPSRTASHGARFQPAAHTGHAHRH